MDMDMDMEYCNDTADPAQSHQAQLLQPIKYIVFHIHFRRTIILPSQLVIATTSNSHVFPRGHYFTHHSIITKSMLIGMGMDLNLVPTFAARIATDALQRIIFSNSNSDFLTISLHITASTECTPIRQQQQEAMMVDRSFSEAMDTVRTVPATQDSIRALQEELNDVGLGGKTCSICLEKMSFGDRRVVKMPCSHAFHKDCIVRWLETSHLCPLCRYSMPTTSSSSR
ncbi:E3 ubiquitin-protein ligase SDIR1-like [Humulus lupulus]|uniref:E3 ubiquitin-protein ligase SDIR1-like n=1 Tax=Humulus lupulus TaxID=3486 RepID=UPI002B407567|nr:E3 ubiquitin-protein ligase SDIR1-like [Humulus lupulus]